MSAAQQRQRAAQNRAEAAGQRALASQDRQSAAHDRDQAAHERSRARTVMHSHSTESNDGPERATLICTARDIAKHVRSMLSALPHL